MNESERYITCGVFSHERKEAKEEQPMSDTLQEREDRKVWLECCQGYSHAPWCSEYKEPDTRRSGEMGHRTNHEQSTSLHQPVARGGGEAWHVGSRGNSPEGDATIYTVKGNHWIGQVKATVADQIVTEHNQHQSLMAEREQMVEALKGVAIMLNTELEKYDKEPWAKRVRAAIATNEQRSTSE